jgi:hypothetical protein
MLKKMKSRRVFLALAFSVSLIGCEPKGPETVPEDLMGVWKTSAPKYKACSFELSTDNLVFRNERLREHSEVGFIAKTEKISERNHISYTIHHKNLEGQVSKLTFYYYPLKGGTIRFKNQKRIEWKKVRSLDK